MIKQTDKKNEDKINLKSKEKRSLRILKEF